MTDIEISYIGFDSNGQKYEADRTLMKISDVWFRNKSIIEERARAMGMENGVWRDFLQECVQIRYEHYNEHMSAAHAEAWCEYSSSDREEELNDDEYELAGFDASSIITDISWVDEDPEARFHVHGME